MCKNDSDADNVRWTLTDQSFGIPIQLPYIYLLRTQHM